MPEKTPCKDCPVRVLRIDGFDNLVAEAGIRHSLNKRAIGMEDIRSGGLEDDALDRCRHWHRWAEALGMPEEVVISLKGLKEKRSLPVRD